MIAFSLNSAQNHLISQICQQYHKKLIYLLNSIAGTGTGKPLKPVFLLKTSVKTLQHKVLSPSFLHVVSDIIAIILIVYQLFACTYL